MRTSLLFIFAFMFLSCKKDESMEISDIPEIEFNSVSSTSVKAYSDSLSFILNYTDGNGDLGENRPEALNAFIVDPRINYTYQLRIPQLAPDNADVPIKGTITLTIKNTIITNGASSQTVNYSIYVKDRAGNQSNSVSSSTITIRE